MVSTKLYPLYSLERTGAGRWMGLNGTKNINPHSPPDRPVSCELLYRLHYSGRLLFEYFYQNIENVDDMTRTLAVLLIMLPPHIHATWLACAAFTTEHNNEHSRCSCQINDAVSLPKIIQHRMRGWENHHLILGIMSRLSPYDNDNHAKPQESGGPIIRTRFELAPLEWMFRSSAKYINISTHTNKTHNKYIQNKPFVRAYTPSPTALRFSFVLKQQSIKTSQGACLSVRVFGYFIHRSTHHTPI